MVKSQIDILNLIPANTMAPTVMDSTIKKSEKLWVSPRAAKISLGRMMAVFMVSKTKTEWILSKDGDDVVIAKPAKELKYMMLEGILFKLVKKDGVWKIQNSTIMKSYKFKR